MLIAQNGYLFNNEVLQTMDSTWLGTVHVQLYGTTRFRIDWEIYEEPPHEFLLLSKTFTIIIKNITLNR